jgi:hypothetical protein
MKMKQITRKKSLSECLDLIKSMKIGHIGLVNSRFGEIVDKSLIVKTVVLRVSYIKGSIKSFY